ncbi:MAG: hypothetical protein J7521_10095 [Caulobacter sp.]|nr:hypothetical protein [Caulobacter sp.]
MGQIEATGGGVTRGAGEGGPFAILNPLVAEIAHALLDLGGAAHRDLVVAYIAKRRGAFRPSETLRGEVEQAFAAYCRGAIDPRAASLLHQPYGPLSQRWALTDRAYRLLRGGGGLARAQ